jgi:LysM repeat protein
MPPPVVTPPELPPPVLPPPVKVEAPKELQTKVYTVKSGDALSLIAQRFKVPAKDIMKMNKISDPNKIKVGQKLKLPGYVDLNAPAPIRKAKKVVAKKTVAPKAKAAAPAVPAAEAAPAAVAPEGGVSEGGAMTEAAPAPVAGGTEVLHVVEPNQDLNSIAMMYGVRVEEVMRMNNLTSPDVKVGQTLKIPPPIE